MPATTLSLCTSALARPRGSGLAGVALRHPLGRFRLRTERHDRIAQTRLRQTDQAGHRAPQILRRAGHQHFIIRDATVTTFGIARDRQADGASLQRVAPTVGAGALTAYAEVVTLIVAPLQTVDEQNHLRGIAVEQANIRRLQPRRAPR